MERMKLESAAASYPYLRGLLSIPVALVFIVAGLTNLEWGPLDQVWVFWGAALVAGVAYLRITRYYNENYGRVTLSTRGQVRAAVATVIGVALISGGVQLDWSFDLPVIGTVASFALIMLAFYAVTVGLKTHQVVIWGSLLVAGLLPVWGGVGPDNKINVGFVVMGVAIMATGIFDHGALKRTFESAKGMSLERGDVGA